MLHMTLVSITENMDVLKLYWQQEQAHSQELWVRGTNNLGRGILVFCNFLLEQRRSDVVRLHEQQNNFQIERY